jgi:hypothetical protein
MTDNNQELPKKQYIPPQILRLMQLGEEKKLWAVMVGYQLGNERKQVIKRNLETEELMKFRETLFRYGLQIPVEPEHWKVIPPYDILEVDIWRQDKYLPDEPYRAV